MLHGHALFGAALARLQGGVNGGVRLGAEVTRELHDVSGGGHLCSFPMRRVGAGDAFSHGAGRGAGGPEAEASRPVVTGELLGKITRS
jgi:hypothetical protein